MTERDVVRAALEHRPPAHVPWNLGFTFEAAQKLREHHGTDDLDPVLRNHIVTIGGMGERSTDIGEGRVRDAFGVVWDRSVDKDIGNVSNCVLPEPTLAGYELPDPHAARPAGPDRAHHRLAARPLPRLLRRLQPLRARVDDARHGEPDDGLLREPRVRRTSC